MLLVGEDAGSLTGVVFNQESTTKVRKKKERKKERRKEGKKKQRKKKMVATSVVDLTPTESF